MFPATITQALWPWAQSRDMRPASEPSLYPHGDLVRDRFWYAQNHLAYRGLNKSDRHVASERPSCPLPDDPQCPATESHTAGAHPHHHFYPHPTRGQRPDGPYSLVTPLSRPPGILESSPWNPACLHVPLTYRPTGHSEQPRSACPSGGNTVFTPGPSTTCWVHLTHLRAPDRLDGALRTVHT